MLIVADAAPLIFLGKISQLLLVSQLYPGEVWLPSVVRDEILRPPLPSQEQERLERCLRNCHVSETVTTRVFAGGLSAADNSVLALALQKRADYLLSDDKLLRRVAVLENLKVVATLGILLRACNDHLLASDDAQSLLNNLVRLHGFRISAEVYEAVCRELRTAG